VRPARGEVAGGRGGRGGGGRVPRPRPAGGGGGGGHPPANASSLYTIYKQGRRSTTTGWLASAVSTQHSRKSALLRDAQGLLLVCGVVLGCGFSCVLVCRLFV